MTTKPRRSADRTSKHPDAVLVSYGDMAYSDEWGYWRGTLSGDLSGKAEFREQPKNFEKDGIEYYFEDFVITTRHGELRGTKNGVYNLTTGDFWDHGRVETATGRWARVVGHEVFERATTTTPGVVPMVGHHTPLVLVPPNPEGGPGEKTLASCGLGAYHEKERTWWGTLTGDLMGSTEYRDQPQTYVIGDTKYFFETFSVAGKEGTLEGSEAGIADRTAGRFWACGFVSKASGRWKRLVGRMVLDRGLISRRQSQPIQARTTVLLVRLAKGPSRDRPVTRLRRTPRTSRADASTSGRARP